MNRRHLPGFLLTIPKRYSEKQEPSSRRDHQHFNTKFHPIKKITEVSPRTFLQNSKSWRTIRSVSSKLPLRTTSVLYLLQRSMATLSSSLDLSTWCNPTRSVGRHTKMLVLISNTFWRFAAHSPYQESPEMLYYFASSHSHCWWERSSGSMLQRRRILRGHSAPQTFWLSSFPWARPMLFVGKLQVFSNNMMNLFQKHGSASKTTS